MSPDIRRLFLSFHTLKGCCASHVAQSSEIVHCRAVFQWFKAAAHLVAQCAPRGRRDDWSRVRMPSLKSTDCRQLGHNCVNWWDSSWTVQNPDISRNLFAVSLEVGQVDTKLVVRGFAEIAVWRWNFWTSFSVYKVEK